jgi:hypothetical protein
VGVTVFVIVIIEGQFDTDVAGTDVLYLTGVTWGGVRGGCATCLLLLPKILIDLSCQTISRPAYLYSMIDLGGGRVDAKYTTIMYYLVGKDSLDSFTNRAQRIEVDYWAQMNHHGLAASILACKKQQIS